MTNSERSDKEEMSPLEDVNDDGVQYLVKGEAFMVRRVLNEQVKVADLEEQRYNVFYTRCHVQNKFYSMIIDRGSYTNITSIALVDELDSHTTKHLMPHKLQWLNDCGKIKVTSKL